MFVLRICVVFIVLAPAVVAQQKPVAAKGAPAAVAQALVEAFNAHDVEGILKTYSPESAARRIPGGDVFLRGHAGIRQKFISAFEKNPKIRVDVVQRIVNGDFAIDKEKISGYAEGAAQYGVVIYEIRDGLVQNEWYLPKESADRAVPRGGTALLPPFGN